MAVIGHFIDYIQADQYKTNDTGRQTKDIYPGEYPVFGKQPKENLQVI
jgi:hypothetical protein